MTRILMEDKDIIVCVKPAGLPTQTASIRQQDLTDEIKNYLHSPYLGLVHRLDQPVEGILVLAKNEHAAADLSRQLQNGRMKKAYLAVTLQNAEEAKLKNKDTIITGESKSLSDYLLKDEKTNLSQVAAKGVRNAKAAELEYITVACRDEIALRRIELKTGRHHQIRVQFSHAGMPLLGDQKYGNEQSKAVSVDKKVSDAALCAYQLSFIHPVTHKKLNFEIEPSAAIFHIF